MTVRTVLSLLAGGASAAALGFSLTGHSAAAVALWLLSALAFFGLLVDGRTDS